MGQVSITLNDRVYRLVCDDGEEDRLVELATYVKSKVTQLSAEVGRSGDERLFGARRSGAGRRQTFAA